MTASVTETIVAAAISIDNVTISLPQPARHPHVLMSAEAFLKDDYGLQATQGFLTSTGRFVNRIQAYQIAWSAKQVMTKLKPSDIPQLFSEDLW